MTFGPTRLIVVIAISRCQLLLNPSEAEKDV